MNWHEDKNDGRILGIAIRLFGRLKGKRKSQIVGMGNKFGTIHTFINKKDLNRRMLFITIDISNFQEVIECG